MKMVLKLLILIDGIRATDDFTCEIERSIPIAPSLLAESINLFLDKAMSGLRLTIWQAAKMDELTNIAQVYIYVDDQERNFATIKIPVKASTQAEIKAADEEIKKFLFDFRYKSFREITVSIICAEKFRKQ